MSDNREQGLPRLITPKQVREALGISASTLWRWINEGKFPRGVELSRGRVVWREADVKRWIDEQFDDEANPATDP